MRNKLLMADYYKSTHHLLYPQNTSYVHSYIESRGTDLPSSQTLFFGLQGFLKAYLQGQFANEDNIKEASEIYSNGFGQEYFNQRGWQLMLDKYDGCLPVIIRALPEGTISNTGKVLLTIENTDADFWWLPQWLETSLLRAVWYPTTVATISMEAKRIISQYCHVTGGSVSPFHLLDFGARGVSSSESAQIGGAAHLINFLGTDTVEGVKYLMDYYNVPVSGFSVIASEHSMTCAYGEVNESICYDHIINSCPDSATVSIVIDTYDDIKAISKIALFKKKILAREGLLVIRPDSGDIEKNPVEILNCLFDTFGGSINPKGYKLLNPKIKMLQGDGISLESLPKVCRAIAKAGFCLDNVMFGMGGQLLQGINRDTMKFAMKASNVIIDGNERGISKHPKGDPTKASKSGRFLNPDLVPVFENGNILIDQTLEQIRARANI